LLWRIFGSTNPSYFVKTREFLVFYTAPEDGEHLPLDLQVAGVKNVQKLGQSPFKWVFFSAHNSGETNKTI
jgi:hypothetical protein